MTRISHIAATMILCLCAGRAAWAQQREGAKISVTLLDPSHLSVPGAQLQLKLDGGVVAAATTDENGHAALSGLKPGRYAISVAKEGFQPLIRPDLVLEAGASLEVELTLAPQAHKESIEVRDTATAVEAGSAPPSTVQAQTARDLPSRPATVSDALPLIPGIVRTPGGGLQLSGSGENRSALIVNSADVTDPATGGFGLTVPIDSVESLNFYQTSFLAEYGRFSAGLVSVETRRGGEKWKWELNDPLPDFSIRSWHLRGLRDATPRVNLEGPLIPGKLYLSEGFEYEVRKILVYTLPYPWNQKTTAGFNSFLQLDWILSDKNLLTATFHLAPQRLGYVNMDYFNPQPTTPDARTHNYSATVSDKLTIFGGLWDNTLSMTKFDASVWAKGPLDLVLQPQGDSGNYFAQQARDAERYGWLSTFSFAPWSRFGTHNFKAGAYLAESYDDGQMHEHPIDIANATGGLLESIAFSGGSPFSNADTEYALFVQDHWTLSPHLAIDLGLRTESQEISEAVRFAPRAGLAWNPFTHLGTVVRAGVGVYYDRVPLGVYSFSDYPNEVVSYYDGNGQITAGPYLFQNGLGEIISRQKLVVKQQTAGNFSPGSTNGVLQVEQPITRFVRLRTGYMQSVSGDLLILDSTLPNPVTNTGMVLLSGTGTARYRQYEATARVRPGEKRELNFSYVRSHATGDLNDFASYIGSFPSPILRPDQVATAPTDLPNRFLVWGRLQLPRGFGIAPVFEYRSGFPYILTNAAQGYVGIPNATRFPNFLSADARVWRDFKVSPKYSLRFSISGFNLSNHFNPEAVHWNVDDPAAGLFFGERHRRFTADFDVIF
ncbi:MAG: carboxypeptidase regulatory-like domain-containing protein [Bryobacteraceae bacterium]